MWQVGQARSFCHTSVLETPMLTKQQLSARTGLMTSSVVAGALGLDPYKGPLTVQMTVRGEREWAGNAATERGDYCEPACLNWAAAQLRKQLKAAGQPSKVVWKKPPFVAHANGWSGDSCDAVFYGDGGKVLALGEAKTVSARQAAGWGQPDTDQVPDRVLVQCCWHLMHHPAADVVYVPVLMGGWNFEFSMYRIERKQSLIDDLASEAKEWHARYILGDEVPPPDGRDTEAVKQRWPFGGAGEMVMDAKMERWAEEKTRWRAIREEAEANEVTARNRLVALLGDHDTAVSEAYAVSYRKCRDSVKVDFKKFVEEHVKPDIEQLKPYTRVARGHRTLLVTPKGAK